MAPRSAPVTSTSLRKPRLRFDDFFSRLWLRIAGRRRILPPAVTLNRFRAELRVFVFGISFHSCVLRRAQQHHHVASVLEGLGLDLPDLLDVIGEAEKQVAAPFRVGLLPAPEHDRDLHLRALVEESLDVALLGVVVVDADLRPELDLLDLDLALVLAGLLRLLFLLVLVLAVVHDLGDGRVGLGGDLDEIEVLAVGVLARLVRGLDSKLGTVVVDQPDARDADRIVDARRVARRWTGLVEWPASGPQRQITKSGLLLLVSWSQHEKPLHAAAVSSSFLRLG